MDYHSPQVTTTKKGVEKVIHQPPQERHHDINTLAAIYNPSTTMTPTISITITLPLDLSEHSPLLLDYDSDLSPSMIQQLEVNWQSSYGINQPYYIPHRYKFMEKLDFKCICTP